MIFLKIFGITFVLAVTIIIIANFYPAEHVDYPSSSVSPLLTNRMVWIASAGWLALMLIIASVVAGIYSQIMGVENGIFSKLSKKTILERTTALVIILFFVLLLLIKLEIVDYRMPLWIDRLFNLTWA